MTGRLSMVRGGHGLVVEDGGGVEVFVPASSLGTALPGDRVSVRVEERSDRRRPVGEVVDVVDAGPDLRVGTYERAGDVGFVVPLDPKARRDILIPQGESGNAEDGDLVVARIVHRGMRRHGPVGRVEESLGAASDPAVRSLAVARERGFRPDFSPQVMEYAEALRGRPPDQWGERADRTDLTTLTIDPGDAKDHDDAISAEAVGTDGWRLSVHIADVAHYVRPGDPVDRAARERGTSVYLVHRVIPMLPETLSADLCSLVPEEVRPAMTVRFSVDGRGAVKDVAVERTLVRVDRKLSYEDAQAMLDREAGADPEVDRTLRAAAAAARRLRDARFKRGALNLDFPEAHIEVDDSGRPVASRRRESLESHRIIEDLMIAANEAIATLATERQLPAPYRVHAPPTGGDLDDGATTLTALGHPVSVPPTPGELQAAVEAARGTPKAHLVNWLVLRMLSRATYSTENVGHFGLASARYAHFTSPIRRYPDLLLHRAVAASLLADGDVADLPSGEDLEALCNALSDREREAEEAERQSVLLSQIELMLPRVGETFLGRVTSVTPFGAFLRLEDPFVEGLLHVSRIGTDYYDFDPALLRLVGRSTGGRVELGMELEVRLSGVDPAERRIDFSMV